MKWFRFKDALWEALAPVAVLALVAYIVLRWVAPEAANWAWIVAGVLAALIVPKVAYSVVTDKSDLEWVGSDDTSLPDLAPEEARRQLEQKYSIKCSTEELCKRLDHFSVVKLMLAAGVDVNGTIGAGGFSVGADAFATVYSRGERTPLMAAAREGLYYTVKLLLAHGAAVNQQTGGRHHVTGPVCEGLPNEERTALVDGLEGGDAKTVALLLEHGADVSLAIAGCGWPSQLVEKPELLRLLVEHGMPIEQRDILGRTPLMTAAEHDGFEALRYCLDHDADVNARDAKGQTALMIAAAEGARAPLVQRLLQWGADPHLRDDDDMTARMLAKARGRSCPKVLVEADLQAPSDPVA